MERETFRVEVITPCFLAGAKGVTEWRSASIRGQLRWWFRAVGGARWPDDLVRVRREEERLFGSTDRRSLLRFRILESPEPAAVPFGTKLLAARLAEIYREPSAEGRLKILGNGVEEGSNPLHYLAFGPVAKGRVERHYLPPRSRASFEIQWGPGSPKREDEIREVFSQALWAWLNLGGIGAKNRKGFGSLHCDTNLWYVAPASLDELETQIKALLTAARGFQKEPDWTHFSAGSRVFIGESTRKWDEAMERLGAWLIGFRRRYGFPGDTRSTNGISLANRDYEWAAPKGTHLQQGVPDRAGFGLPLPFRRKINQQVLGETVVWGARPKPGEPQGKDSDARRASPLLLHVSKLGDSYVPVLTYLPARFLPKGGDFKFRGPFLGLYPATPLQRSIITRFLEDLKSKSLIREILP
jgi:CRISPR type III-B/RAMP module RAMP protein Cmr1